jgi:hypothetical protein
MKFGLRDGHGEEAKGGLRMHRYKIRRLLIVPMVLAPMTVVGSLTFSPAAFAGPPKIVCTSLSGNYISGSTVTISGCTHGPNGATSATTPLVTCQTNCMIIETWSDAGSTTTNETYNAPDKTGSTATKKCKSSTTVAVATEKGKVTGGYGAGGKIKGTVCAFSDGTLSLAPGTKLDL